MNDLVRFLVYSPQVFLVLWILLAVLSSVLIWQFVNGEDDA